MNILDTSVGHFCMTSPQVAPAGHSLMSDTVKHSCRILFGDTFLRSFLRLLFLWGTLWRDDTLHRVMSYANGARVAMEKLPEGIKNRMSGRWVHHGPGGVGNCFWWGSRGCVEACFVFLFPRAGMFYSLRRLIWQAQYFGHVSSEIDSHKKVSYFSNDCPTQEHLQRVPR
jgi:hypothetical protein